LDANPVGLVVLAIAALVGALYWAYNNIKPVHDAIDFLWKLITGFWTWMTGGAKGGDIWGWLWKGLQAAWNFIIAPFKIGQAFITSIINWLTGGAGSGDLWGWIWKGIMDAWFKINVVWMEIYVWVMNTIKWFTNLPSKLWDWIWKGLMDAWFQINTIWMEIYVFIMNKISWFKSLPSKLWDWLWSGVKDAVDKVFGFFKGLTDYLAALPENMKKWGTDIILGLINGIVNAIPGLRQALSAIGINFPQSPPKEGPLAAITAAGAESWTSGIAQSMSKGLQKFNLKDNIGKLPSLSSMPGVSSAMGMAGKGGSQPIQLTVQPGAVVIKGNATKEVMENAGTQLGTSILDKITTGLISDANKKGVSIINTMR
jgi:hypothetical protein